jgi:hypothetical protein
MLRQRTTTLLIALAALAAPAAVRRAEAQAPSLQGVFQLNTRASEDVNRAIDNAVSRMNFIVRPIARGRLRKTNEPYRRVTISHTQSQVSVTTDARAAIVTPATGSPIKWTRPEDNEKLNVSTEWEAGRLKQTFQAEDGRRVNVWSISGDGRTLTMEATITSPRLPRPLVYHLVYDRVS